MQSLFDGKVCSKCGQWKPFDEFYKNSTKPNGRHSHCKACISAFKRVDRANNPDKYHKQQRASRQANRETIRRQAQRRQRTSQNDLARRRDEARRYRARYPERVRVRTINRRARLLQAEGKYTAAEWQALCAWFGNVCLACGADGSLSVDHVVPLVAGGTNGIDNIQPLCVSCNSRKRTRATDYRDPQRLADFLDNLG